MVCLLCRSIWTPRVRAVPSVASVSPAASHPRTCVVPLASMPIRIARCERDLSPGTRVFPWRDCPGWIVSFSVAFLLIIFCPCLARFAHGKELMHQFFIFPGDEQDF